ncbi:MAG: hypothetical protein ABWY06_24410 [Pseudomonas sp.]|uniref:hypothetical protein n=1 Tax=Pseudomonas sp. TaxID=306 RepID=UPI00339544EE
MKLDEVPQDHSSTYGGHSKLVYALDAGGRYQSAQSDGWEPEAYATQLAVAELQAQEQAALSDWQAGRASPLKYLMCQCRMDEPALAQISGLWRWRIRRHFQPHHYARLPRRVLARYAEALGLDVAQLIRYQRESA